MPPNWYLRSRAFPQPWIASFGVFSRKNPPRVFNPSGTWVSRFRPSREAGCLRPPRFHKRCRAQQARFMAYRNCSYLPQSASSLVAQPLGSRYRLASKTAQTQPWSLKSPGSRMSPVCPSGLLGLPMEACWPSPPIVQTGLMREPGRSEEHTSELQSHLNLVCRLLLEKKKTKQTREKTYRQEALQQGTRKLDVTS